MAGMIRNPKTLKATGPPALPKGFKPAAPIKNKKLRALLSGPDLTTSGGAHTVVGRAASLNRKTRGPSHS